MLARLRRTLLVTTAVLTLTVGAAAQRDGPARSDDESATATERSAPVQARNLDASGLALQGYDPVAYFPEGGGVPRKGSARRQLDHAGVRYHFADEQNRDLFRATPDRFVPAYGGWCAWAMSQDYEAPAHPESFRIHRGRLFVFYKALFNDTRAQWLEDETRLAQAADGHWERRTGEKPPVAGRDTSLLNLGAAALALDGYDPVAYFAVGGGKPRKGNEDLALVHEGVRYLFATEANRAAFTKNPETFEPAYGGWCAYAVAVDGSLVEIDPESFLIQDGRLHVFYNGFLSDTRALWRESPPDFGRKAAAHWKQIVARGGEL